ncbi:MAG: hypothetical protein ACKOXP_08655 [Flavobacteriales bacterium]
MKHLKKYFLTSILFHFIGFMTFSCTDVQSTMPKNLDDIRSKSNYSAKPEKKKQAEDFSELMTAYNQDSVRLSILGITRDTTDSFLDQFIYEKSERFLVSDSSNHVFNHRFWLFKPDSNAVKNVFYNWFDQQFCQRNDAIKMYSQQKLYREHLLFICTNQSIHVVSSSSKIDALKWIRYIQFTEKKVQFIYICHQPKNKKAQWFTYKQQQLTPIPAI